MFVSERESQIERTSERDKDCVCVRERERESDSERENVCVCVCVREREKLQVSISELRQCERKLFPDFRVSRKTKEHNFLNRI